jgi:hypothetical protein
MGGQLFTSLRETVGTGSVLGLKVFLGVDGDLTLAAFDDQGLGYVRFTDDFKSLQIDYQPATGAPADSIAIDLRTQPLGSPQSAVKSPASHHRTHAPVRRIAVLQPGDLRGCPDCAERVACTKRKTVTIGGQRHPEGQRIFGLRGWADPISPVAVAVWCSTTQSASLW